MSLRICNKMSKCIFLKIPLFCQFSTRKIYLFHKFFISLISAYILSSAQLIRHQITQLSFVSSCMLKLFLKNLILRIIMLVIIQHMNWFIRTKKILFKGIRISKKVWASLQRRISKSFLQCTGPLKCIKSLLALALLLVKKFLVLSLWINVLLVFSK